MDIKKPQTKHDRVGKMIKIKQLLNKYICLWFGHDFIFVRQIRKGVVEKRCKRCNKLLAFGFGKSVVVTKEIRKLHDELLIQEYFNG